MWMERRTDLAVEERELLGEDIKGIEYTSEKVEGLPIERLRILTKRAAQLLKKPMGHYVTVELPPLTDSIRDTDSRVRALSEEIRRAVDRVGQAQSGRGRQHRRDRSDGDRNRRVIAGRHQKYPTLRHDRGGRARVTAA